MIRNITIMLKQLLTVVALFATITVTVQAQEHISEPDTDMDRPVKVMPYSYEQEQKIYRNVSPHAIRYTKKHPIIIAMDWAFAPFSYYSDNGTPKGMLIDVVEQVFSTFRVPYEIKMMSREDTHKQLLNGNATLIIDIDNLPEISDVKHGEAIVADYNVAVMRSKRSKMMRSIMLLDKEDTVMVNSNSYSYYYLNKYFKGNVPFTMENQTPTVALNMIVKDGANKFYVWDEMALQAIVHKYNVEHMVTIERIDVPQGHLYFYGRDTLLLHDIDLTIQHLQATNHYETDYSRWMDSQNTERKSLSAEVIIFALLVIAVIIVIFLLLRTTLPNRLKREFYSMMNIGIQAAHSQLIAVSVRKSYCYNISGDFLPAKGLPLNELMKLSHPDDVYKMLDAKNKIDNGITNLPKIKLRMKRYDDPNGRWYNMVIYSAVKAHGRKPLYVYMVINDETEHKDEQLKLAKVLNEYSSITDISNVGRAYYNAKGKLVHANKHMIEFFNKGGSQRGETFLHDTSLYELCIKFNGVMLEKDMDTYFCAPIDIPELNLKSAAEIRLRTVYNDVHHNEGYVMTLYDKALARSLYSDFKDIDINMASVKEELRKYQSELKFVIDRNKMYPFKWEVGNDYLEVSVHTLFDKRVPFTEYIKRVGENDKDDILAALENPARYITQPIHVVRQLNGVHVDNPCGWYDVHLIPDYDTQGNYVGVFGIRCDITELVETQNKLREQTEKALESGKQKAVFLSNMTHELRTPLNAINGFAEIMSFLTTEEEKKEYIDIMDHNCTMLICLIDNILHLSTIDTEGLRIRPHHVDFAKVFRQGAEEMRRYMVNPEVSYRIDTPMHTLMLDVDAERIMQMLDIVVNNASKFTQKGFVHIGYRYNEGTLTVYCRDTGCGISKEKQEEIFRRFVKLDEFVQGMGLGLALCKSIADAMGARIDLYSQEGEGTVVSVSLDVDNLHTPPRPKEDIE